MASPTLGPHFHQARRLVGLAVVALCTTGCDEVFDAFQDGSSLVHVFTTHHGTPEGGIFPDYGSQGARKYETDLGWTVTVTEGFLVTSGVALRTCDGDLKIIDFHYGQFPEDLTEPDLETMSLGSTKAKATTYCLAVATYSPFEDVDRGENDHQPASEVILGGSLYLRGLAEKDGEAITFEVLSHETMDVSIDISTIDDGGPFRVTGDETFPPELLLSKTYDRFFDGVDFSAMDPKELETQVWAVIDAETRMSVGTIPAGT